MAGSAADLGLDCGDGEAGALRVRIRPKRTSEAIFVYFDGLDRELSSLLAVRGDSGSSSGNERACFLGAR